MGDIDIYPYPEQNNGVTDIAQQANAPVAPDVGELWLDTDENAGTGLSSIIAYNQITSTSASATSTSTVDIPGLETTVVVPAGRRIRISGKFVGYANTVPARVSAVIREGSTVLNNFESMATVVGNGVGVLAQAVISPSAGTHTYKISLRADLQTVLVYVDASVPGFILVEDITGSLWPAGSSVTPAMVSGGPPIVGYKNGGVYTERATNPINAYADGTASITIPNPGIPVMVTAAYNGFGQNFSAITFAEARVAISFDGGSSFTAGVQAGAVFGQGGSNYNRGNLSASWFRSGTPTGNIVIKMEAKSDSTATGVVGHLTYTMMPL